MTSFERLDDQQLTGAASLFEALAHPVRLRIVCGLLDGGCCVGSMVDCLGLPQAYVSRHLAILRDAGVVRATADGRSRTYEVVHPLVPALVSLLKPKESP
jgi:ArsR family transcriptional regulator